MAEINRGILGEVSGTVGTVVGAVVRGVATIRSKPRKSGKQAVQSQLNQQYKFAIVVAFMHHFKSILDLGLRSYTRKMSTTNAAVQHALKNAITGVAPNFKLDFSRVLFSKGSLENSLNLVLTPPVSGGKLFVTWDPAEEFSDAELLVRNLDEATFVVYNETSTYSFTALRGVARGEGAFKINTPKAFIGNKLHIWYFFCTPDGKTVSNTVYLGTTVTVA